MMPGESQTWQLFKEIVPNLDPQRIENTLRKGTPDVNYTGGWVELKYIKAWPVKPGTIVKIAHFTDEQKTWLMRRYLLGGKAFVLLRVGRCEWLIFEAPTAKRWLGVSAKTDLIQNCSEYWDRKPTTQELYKWLI